MTDKADMEGKTTSAMLARSFGWDSEATNRVLPAEPYIDFAAEAVLWQGISHHAGSTVSVSLMNSFGKSKGGITVVLGERLAEVLGIMGAIGEQAGLCWTAVQDAERFVQTSSSRDDVHQRLVLRAMSEFAGHFILGVGHSLGNLALRTIMLNSEAGRSLSGMKRYESANGFPPNSDDRNSWLTINDTMLQNLHQAAVLSGNDYMVRLVQAVKHFYVSPEFQSLDNRRGMDYHRRRPQSVAHTATRTGLTETHDGWTSMAVGIPRIDPDADADVVYAAILKNIPVMQKTLNTVASVMGDLIRHEGIEFTDDAQWINDRQQTLNAYHETFDPKPKS